MKKDFVKKIFICLVAFVVSFFCATPLFNSNVFALTNIQNFEYDPVFNNHEMPDGWTGKNGQELVILTNPDDTKFITKANSVLNTGNHRQLLNTFQPDEFNSYLGQVSYSSSDILALDYIVSVELPRCNSDGTYDFNTSNYFTFRFGTSDDCIIYDLNGTNRGKLGVNFSFGSINSSTYNPSNGNYFGIMIYNLEYYSNPYYVTYFGDSIGSTFYDVFKNNSTIEGIFYFAQTVNYLYNNNLMDDWIALHPNYIWQFGIYFGDTFNQYNTPNQQITNNVIGNIGNDINNNLNNQFNELENMGSGSFDGLESELGDLSDSINNSNNIINDVDRPSVDSVDNAVSILDTVLDNTSDSFGFMSDIMSIFFDNVYVSSIMLLSLSAGLLKYIFFGRGA